MEQLRAQRDAARNRRVARIADKATAAVRAARRLTQRTGVVERPPTTAEAAAPHVSNTVDPGPAGIFQPWSQRAWAADSLDREQGAARAAERLRGRLREGGRLRVAGVLTPRTAMALAPDCDLRSLRPSSWRDDLEGFVPDLLLVEPARHEPGDIRVSEALPAPEQLIDLLDWCVSEAVPSVFWHNTDPQRFDSYLGTAALFDYVFTPDADLIPALRRELGHARVGLLPFAAQPRHFSPVRSEPRGDHAVFAGGYYARAAARTRDLHTFVAGIEGLARLDIYDPNPGATLAHHTYPPAVHDMVRGHCSADELAAIYRAAGVALNLSTVKGSSSHFPRRSLEAILTGTPVVSNYTMGLRNYFGNLVAMADGADGVRAHVLRLTDDDLYRDRVTTTALRTALREHTWVRRLEQMCAAITGERIDTPNRVGVLAECSSREAVSRFAAALARQKNVDAHGLVVALTNEAVTAAKEVGLPVCVSGDHRRLSELLPTLPVCVFDLDDWYGPHYLASLLQVFEYDDAEWATKREHHVLREGRADRRNKGAAHNLVPTSTVSMRRSIGAANVVAAFTPDQLLTETRELSEDARIVAVDRLDYCADAGDAPAELVAALSADIDTRLPPLEMDAATVTGPLQANESADLLMLRPDHWPAASPPGSALHLKKHGVAALRIRRDQDRGAAYLWTGKRLPVADHTRGSGLPVRVETHGAMDVRSVARWFDGTGSVLSTAAGLPGINETFAPPPEAETFELGLRVTGVGISDVRLLAVGHRDPATAPHPPTAPSLVVADAYPSHDNLYRYGFVHARVREYLRRGASVDVFRYGAGDADDRYEFEGVVVRTGDAAALRDELTRRGRRNVLVHFLSRDLWQVLREVSDDLSITIWVHGWEVQDWRHRPWASDAERAQAQRASRGRAAFWRDLLADPPPSVRFIFVSDHFMRQTLGDLERDIPASHRAVIPNPIDTSVFEYIEKTDAARLKILSVRPYAGPVYANDLAVAAVLELAEERWFDELEFRFVGDGPEFDSTLAPLRHLSNVIIERGYRAQHDIARLHRDYGVFLVPTRADTHGVSRDEAMASGLVPVTSAVGAVPEFVSDTEGYLADPEDSRGLADAIRDLYAHPEVFHRKSRAAAERVRHTTAGNILIPEELAFALRDEAGSPSV